MTIKIAFRYDDDRWFSRLICWWRGGDSAHCEVAMPPPGDLEGESLHCISASWLDKGVRGKVMPLPPEKWRIYTVTAEVDPVRWLAEHDHEPYGWAGLLGFVLPPLLRKPRGWICTRVAAHIMGLPMAHTHDLVALESICARYGTRLQ
jgi:hypothetical protein